MSDGFIRSRPRRHPRVWKPVWVPTKGVLSALSYGPLRMKVTGREHLPPDGPTLIVSNHVAFIDPLLVAVAALPRPVWTMGKEELFGPRALDAWLSRIGGFPVRRQSPDVWAVRMGRDLLARGESLLIFPEGGVTRTGRMSPGFSGAGYFATRPDVTVVPAAIWDSQMLKGPVRIRFGAPIDMDEIRRSPRAGRNRRPASPSTPRHCRRPRRFQSRPSSSFNGWKRNSATATRNCRRCSPTRQRWTRN